MKKRVNVILPENAIKEIRERMLSEGYSLREKSKWIAEAITDFLKLNEFESLVEMATTILTFSKIETVYIDNALEEQIEHAVLEVRKKYPMLEGVKSLIIRASIVRRLVLKTRINSD